MDEVKYNFFEKGYLKRKKMLDVLLNKKLSLENENKDLIDEIKAMEYALGINSTVEDDEKYNELRKKIKELMKEINDLENDKIPYLENENKRLKDKFFKLGSELFV